MCDPISIMAAAAVVGAGTSIYSGVKQSKAAKKGARQAEAMAADERARQTRETNRVNQKSPDLAAIMGANRARNLSGVGSTTLSTGLAGQLSTRLATSGGVGSLLGGTSALGA